MYTFPTDGSDKISNNSQQIEAQPNKEVEGKAQARTYTINPNDLKKLSPRPFSSNVDEDSLKPIIASNLSSVIKSSVINLINQQSRGATFKFSNMKPEEFRSLQKTILPLLNESTYALANKFEGLNDKVAMKNTIKSSINEKRMNEIPGESTLVLTQEQAGELEENPALVHSFFPFLQTTLERQRRSSAATHDDGSTIAAPQRRNLPEGVAQPAESVAEDDDFENTTINILVLTPEQQAEYEAIIDEFIENFIANMNQKKESKETESSHVQTSPLVNSRFTPTTDRKSVEVESPPVFFTDKKFLQSIFTAEAILQAKKEEEQRRADEDKKDNILHTEIKRQTLREEVKKEDIQLTEGRQENVKTEIDAREKGTIPLPPEPPPRKA